MSNTRFSVPGDRSFLRADLVYERPGLIGQGLFARTDIPQGVVIGCLTPGRPVALPIDASGQVDYGPWASAQTIDLMLTPDALYCLVKDFGPGGPHGADLINHSCTPNCEVEARLLVRTARAIAAHEELFVDYLASQLTIYKEGIPCLCRPRCPTVI